MHVTIQVQLHDIVSLHVSAVGLSLVKYNFAYWHLLLLIVRMASQILKIAITIMYMSS